MKEVNNILKKIDDKLWDGKVKETFELFKKILETDELKSFKKDVVQQKIRFEQNESNNKGGTHNISAYNEEFAKISKALLNILEEIKDEVVEFCKYKKEHENESQLSTKNTDQFNTSMISSEEELLLNSFKLMKSQEEKIQEDPTFKNKAILKQIKRKVIENFFQNDQIPENLTHSSAVSSYMSTLFNEILTIEELNAGLYAEMLLVRSDRKKFKWYDRSLLISAITLRLLKDQKLNRDTNKSLELLIDFVSEMENDDDYELENRTKALVGLTFGLYLRHTSINRYSHLKKKLTSLQNQPKVQRGLALIQSILFNFQENITNQILPQKIFNSNFFKNSENWFVPFHNDNPAVINFFDRIGSNKIDFDELTSHLNENIPSYYKYFYCFATEQGRIRKVDDLEAVPDDSIKLALKVYHHNEYQSYYSAILTLFQHSYIKENKEDLYNQLSELNFYTSKLKDIVLSNFEKLKLGYQFNFNKKRFKAALVNLKDLEKSNYNDPILNKHLGDCHFELNKFSKAIVYYERFLLSEPEDKWVLFRLAKIYKEKENIDQAIDLLKNIKSPNKSMVFELGSCYYIKKNYKNAVEYLDKLDNIENYIIGLIKMKAICYYQLGEIEKAESIFKTVIDLDSSNYILKIEQADYYKESGMFKTAIELYRNLQENDKIKKDDKTYLKIAIIHCLLGLENLSDANSAIKKHVKHNKKLFKKNSHYNYYFLIVLFLNSLVRKNKDDCLFLLNLLTRKDKENLRKMLDREMFNIIIENTSEADILLDELFTMKKSQVKV